MKTGIHERIEPVLERTYALQFPKDEDRLYALFAVIGLVVEP
jgi:hypothetical protein